MSSFLTGDGKRIAIYGTTGCGKSTLAKSILREVPRVMAFDVKNDPDVFDSSWDKVVGVAAALDYLDEATDGVPRWKQSKMRLAVLPERGVRTIENQASWLARMAFDIQGKAKDHLVLLLEEAAMSVPHALRRDESGVLEATLQGRSRGLSIIAVSQRPQNVNKNFRSNASIIYSFQLTDPKDAEAAIGGMFSKKHQKELTELARFDYIKFEVGRGNTEEAIARFKGGKKQEQEKDELV